MEEEQQRRSKITGLVTLALAVISAGAAGGYLLSRQIGTVSQVDENSGHLEPQKQAAADLRGQEEQAAADLQQQEEKAAALRWEQAKKADELRQQAATLGPEEDLPRQEEQAEELPGQRQDQDLRQQAEALRQEEEVIRQAELTAQSEEQRRQQAPIDEALRGVDDGLDPLSFADGRVNVAQCPNHPNYRTAPAWLTAHTRQGYAFRMCSNPINKTPDQTSQVFAGRCENVSCVLKFLPRRSSDLTTNGIRSAEQVIQEVETMLALTDVPRIPKLIGLVNPDGVAQEVTFLNNEPLSYLWYPSLLMTYIQGEHIHSYFASPSASREPITPAEFSCMQEQYLQIFYDLYDKGMRQRGTGFQHWRVIVDDFKNHKAVIDDKIVLCPSISLLGLSSMERFDSAEWTKCDQLIDAKLELDGIATISGFSRLDVRSATFSARTRTLLSLSGCSVSSLEFLFKHLEAPVRRQTLSRSWYHQTTRAFLDPSEALMKKFVIAELQAFKDQLNPAANIDAFSALPNQTAALSSISQSNKKRKGLFSTLAADKNHILIKYETELNKFQLREMSIDSSAVRDATKLGLEDRGNIVLLGANFALEIFITQNNVQFAGSPYPITRYFFKELHCFYGPSGHELQTESLKSDIESLVHTRHTSLLSLAVILEKSIKDAVRKNCHPATQPTEYSDVRREPQVNEDGTVVTIGENDWGMHEFEGSNQANEYFASVPQRVLAALSAEPQMEAEVEQGIYQADFETTLTFILKFAGITQQIGSFVLRTAQFDDQFINRIIGELSRFVEELTRRRAHIPNSVYEGALDELARREKILGEILRTTRLFDLDEAYIQSATGLYEAQRAVQAAPAARPVRDMRPRLNLFNENAVYTIKCFANGIAEKIFKNNFTEVIRTEVDQRINEFVKQIAQSPSPVAQELLTSAIQEIAILVKFKGMNP